jgi:hypothetical protein
MKYLSVRSLACAAVTLALGLPAGPAGAVVYSSVFDPVDFEGVATFDVSQGCLDAGPGSVVNDGSTCTVIWLGATITLKDPPATPLTFSYDPAFLPSPTAVDDIWVESGELVGVNSSIIGPVIIVGDPHPDFNGPWWIEFEFTPASAFSAFSLDGPIGSGAFGLGTVNLFTGSCDSGGDFYVDSVDGPFCTRNDDPTSVADVQSFARVAIPEPGTLGLLLGALAAGGIARRRGRNRR